MEVNEHSHLYSERPVVRGYEERYGILRAQGLKPSESLAFVQKLLGTYEPGRREPPALPGTALVHE